MTLDYLATLTFTYICLHMLIHIIINMLNKKGYNLTDPTLFNTSDSLSFILALAPLLVTLPVFVIELGLNLFI